MQPVESRVTSKARQGRWGWRWAVVLSAGLVACAHQAPTGGGGVSRPVAAPAVPAAASAVSAAASANTGASANASPAPSPSNLPPFATVIRDAKRIDGPVVAWQKEDKLWLELGEKDFGAPLFLSPKIASGIGEGGLFGGLMGGRTGAGKAQWVEFRRLYNQVQLIARNAAYVAQPGSPQARAVERAFSPSLVASTQVVSQPHPERKTVLVEATTLFMTDIMGLAGHLQRTYRQPYALDPRNSGILSVRGRSEGLSVMVQTHFAAAGLTSPLLSPGASVPTTLPDARSLFVQQHYSLSRLPLEPMRPRLADARLGHFITAVHDFTDERARTPRQRYVQRWRLEKQDPSAERSPPVKPLVYWIDRSVPLRYRGAIKAGILEWNKAFERIGFDNAIEVREQPDNADFDTLETGVASVRWMTNASALFGAVGPTHVDPRSGEILDADIAIESLSSRATRTLRTQVLAHPGWQDWWSLMQLPAPSAALRSVFPEVMQVSAGSPSWGHAIALGQACEHADMAAEQLGYALDVLSTHEAAGVSDETAQAFVEAYLKDVTMHEVGHTLGLRHNFRASRVYAEAQLSDPEFTRNHALTGSVMEYAAVNLPALGQAPGTAYFQTTLGPYDYWAIEYAYKPVPAEQELAELARIAGRSGEPELAYGTDEDHALGLDPETQQGDLGRDPVVFARKRIRIAQQVLRRLEARPLQVDEDYAGLRRRVSFALRDVARVTGILLREIGGLRTLRDAPNTGRDPLEPVPLAQQRQALDLLVQEVLAPDSLQVSPALQRRLAPDFLERGDAMLGIGSAAVSTDFTPQQQISDLQRTLQVQLLSDAMAARLLDSAAKADPQHPGLALADLYQQLGEQVWAEVLPSANPGSVRHHAATASAARQVEPLRRVLQRDHVLLVSQWLLQPSQAGRMDMRLQIQRHARQLLAGLQSVRYRSSWAPDTALHLDDCLQMLRNALQARVVRPGV